MATTIHGNKQATESNHDHILRLEYNPGDDIVLGDSGDDVLVGGSGDDILDGGTGKNTYLGKAGCDTFVLHEGHGYSHILDFQDGVDVIGLTSGLTFEDLDIVQQGNDSLIRIDGYKLAVVKSIQAEQLGVEDFVSVRFSQFEGLRLPVAPQVLVHMD